MIIVILMCFLAPSFMGVKNLDQYQVAKIVEIYLSLMGIVLILPVFIPDMNRDIRDLISSKKEPMLVLHCIRVLEALLIVLIVGSVFLAYLKIGRCEFPFGEMLFSLNANAIFLGGLGMMVFAIADQLALAYMIPIVYYIACYGAGKKYLGNLYLFTMQYGSFLEKHYILLTGVLMILGGIVIRDINNLST